MRLSRHRVTLLAATAIWTLAASSALAQDDGKQTPPVKVAAVDKPDTVTAPVKQGEIQIAAAAPRVESHGTEAVTVTARRREENVQDVPLAVSVVNSELLDKTGTVNFSQLTQLAPSLQFISTNPRNTGFNIRGLGSSFGLANDGLEPGVGIYIDQVYYARPAIAAFDFIDTDHIEILRGPQGTLFGKNSTGGVISITSRAPSFMPESQFEATGGNIGFYQAKASLSGPITDDLAARLSFTTTHRSGVLTNVTTGGKNNDISNIGIRGQLLYKASDAITLQLSADYSEQTNQCCTQVYVRTGTTLKPAAQQFPALAAGLGYAPPSTNPYDRLTDVNSPIQAKTDVGGVSAIADWDFGWATLTSVSAYRWWNWRPKNDRDYTRLSIQTASNNPDQQDQYSQEFRIASNGKNTLDYVAGVYVFGQTINGQPLSTYGSDAAPWLLGPAPANPTNLLDGYRSNAVGHSATSSKAIFGEVTWNVTEALSVTGGLRYTWENKSGTYNQTVSGGLATTDATLISKKNSIVRAQSYVAHVSDDSPSGRVNVAYKFTDDILGYVSYAQGYKSGGINMAGLPLNAANLPSLAAAAIRPERNNTVELGAKTQFFDGRFTLNVALFDTKVRNYQANIVDTGPGALRGYLANVDKVHVNGVELDSSFVIDENLSGFLSYAHTNGKYVSFLNGPCPLEQIGTATTVCNLSGRPLPGLSRNVWSVGAEYTRPVAVGNIRGEGYVHVEASTRTKQYGDASDSVYSVIDGYGLVNLSAGLRQDGPWEVFAWVRNVGDVNYIQNLTIQSGNSGLITGTPSDPRTFGLTIRAKY